jgi:hypothetical protein
MNPVGFFGYSIFMRAIAWNGAFEEINYFFHYAAIRGGCSDYLPKVSYVAAERSGQRHLGHFVYNMLNRAYQQPCPGNKYG